MFGVVAEHDEGRRSDPRLGGEVNLEASVMEVRGRVDFLGIAGDVVQDGRRDPAVISFMGSLAGLEDLLASFPRKSR